MFPNVNGKPMNRIGNKKKVYSNYNKKTDCNSLGSANYLDCSTECSVSWILWY